MLIGTVFTGYQNKPTKKKESDMNVLPQKTMRTAQ